MCCDSKNCKCPNKGKSGYSIFVCENSNTFPFPDIYLRDSSAGMNFSRPVWNSFERKFECTCKITSPEKLIILPYKGNEHTKSMASFGETEGLFPQKKPLYKPSEWDVEKTKMLLKCRAAIDLVSTRGESFKKNWPKKIDDIYGMIIPYHLKVNFPSVDTEIANNPGVKWFFLDPNKNAPHTGIDRKRQEIVRSYGPFHNVGGGDVKPGDTYVIFYKLKDE